MRTAILKIPIGLLLWMLITNTGCIPYTNRTRYYASNIIATSVTTADTTQPIVAFGLNRQLTSKIYPFIGYLGEKGDFALSVQLYGAGARKYRALLLKSMQIESGGKVHFATTDSAFVQFRSFREVDNNRHYTSEYVVALLDSVKKPFITAEYILVTHRGAREPYTLRRRLDMDGKRGLDGY